MESKLILKSSSSSILFPVTAKRSSLPNLFGSSKKPKAWNSDEKRYGVSLRLQRPHQLLRKEEVDNVRGNFVHKKRYVWANNAVPEGVSHQPESIVTSNYFWETVQRKLDLVNRFGRLTVMLSTAVSVISMSLLTITKMSDISLSFLTNILPVIVAAVCMNLFVSGINHLSDIEIDKVNKPDQPIASGEFSEKTATFITVFAAIMGLAIPMFLGSWPLFWVLFVGFLLFGFAYSVDLPFLRWKRYPIMVAVYMLVNTSLTNIAYYLHMQTRVLGRPAILSKPLIFATTITTIMMIVFGVFKDLSDVAGDKLDGIRSLPIILGEKRVFKICVTILQIIYFAAMLVGSTLSNPWSKFLTIGGHAVMTLILSNRIQSFDYSGPAAYKSFYIFLWKLYFVEYILVQFAR